MATATDTPTSKPAPRDDRVYHPLDQLRGIIRKYILIEGVLSLFIFFIAWFTIALALDYGIFKAFSWDWAQHAAWWLRLVALLGALSLLAAILIFRIVRRLSTEFSYPALALVLERKFPKVLGDRLITAVELADVESTAKFGYSAAMIRKTIDEARERIGTVPVNEVFNWRRLRLMGLLAVGWVLGLVILGFGSYAIAAGAFQPTHAAWKCYHVSSILVERDMLLRDTPWPRRALLELKEADHNGKLVDMKETGIRVARDGSPPKVFVKAYRWVIADRTRTDGWRPLMWKDVTESFVGTSVPALPKLESDATTKPSIAIDPEIITVDEFLENAPTRDKVS